MGKVRAEIVSEMGSGDADAPDKGGLGNVRSRLFGSPQLRLVSELAPIFAWFKGYPKGTRYGGLS